MIQISFLLLMLASSLIAGEAIIRPGDTVHLRAAVPQGGVSISNFYHVGDSGKIDLPYVGKVTIGGLTTSEAAHVIDEVYLSQQVFSHPAATVNIGGPDPFVIIDGQVAHPQHLAIRPDLTLLQAITEAGGFTDSADQKAVRLEQAASGHALVCDVTMIIRQPDQDLVLHAGDKIFVQITKP